MDNVDKCIQYLGNVNVPGENGVPSALVDNTEYSSGYYRVLK